MYKEERTVHILLEVKNGNICPLSAKFTAVLPLNDKALLHFSIFKLFTDGMIFNIFISWHSESGIKSFGKPSVFKVDLIIQI